MHTGPENLGDQKDLAILFAYESPKKNLHNKLQSALIHVLHHFVFGSTNKISDLNKLGKWSKKIKKGLMSVFIQR